MSQHQIHQETIAGRITKYFVISAACVLVVVGSAKVIGSLLSQAPALSAADPIFDISFQKLMVVAGLIELIVAMICLLTFRGLLGLFCVGWLATSVLVYRLGLVWLGWHLPCGCLGSLAWALHLSPTTADALAKILLTYLMAGSLGLMMLHARKRRTLRGLART